MDDALVVKNSADPVPPVKRISSRETSGGFNRSRATLNGSYARFLHLSPSNEREPASGKEGGRTAWTYIALCFIFLFGERKKGGGNPKGINFVAFLARCALRSDYLRV